MSGTAMTNTAGTNTMSSDDMYDNVMGGLSSNRLATSAHAKNTQNLVNSTADETQGLVNSTAKTTQGLVNNTAKTTQNLVNSTANQTQKQLTSGFAGVNSGIANLDGDIASMNKGMTTGFAGVNNNLNSGFAGVNKNINTGVASLGTSMNQGFTGVSNAMKNYYNAGVDNTNAGFASLSDIVNSGFADYANNLTATKNALLSGQGTLGDAIKANKNAAATYYDALAAQGAQTQAGIQGMTSNFNDFTTGYEDDVVQANKGRAQLQSAMEGGFANTQDLIGTTTNATQTAQDKLMKAVGGLQTAQTAQGNQMQQGFASQQQAAAQGQNEFAQQINNVRQALVQNGDAYDDATRAQMLQVSNAFDQQGNLIANSFDAQGNFITRTMDATGQLLIRSFDQSGQENSQMLLNVQQILRAAQNYSGVGANQSMAGLTNPNGMPPVVAQGGFIPYMQT